MVPAFIPPMLSISRKSSTIPSTLLPLLLLPAFTNAYSWNFQATPQQCTNLTINIDGTDGRPPYRILILPFGPSPLPNNIEARKIMDVGFDGTATSLSFQLNYPANSQFVAVVSDTNGFGSGGTSVAATISDSSDSSCFDSSKSVAPLFPFNIFPVNQIVQCQDTRLWWDGTDTSIEGIPIFQGVIPGGQSFTIPRGQITNITGEGTGFTWKPNVRSGTTLYIVGGDNRGNGTAGSTSNLVGAGINNDGSCLNDNSPSSTPGSPAGGSYPTSTDGTGSGVGSGGGGSKSNVGAIVGGVIGGLAGVAILVLILLFFKRRQRLHKRQKERPVDLLNADEDGDESHSTGPLSGRNDLPQYYEPEPFLVPDPTSNDGHTMFSERPLSGSSITGSRSATPDLLGYAASASATTTTTRKGGPPRQLRPVNIIQHDDAGPSAADGDAETIELPPAYTNIKKMAVPSDGERTEGAAAAVTGETTTPPPHVA